MYSVIDIIYFLKHREQSEIGFRYIFIYEQYKNRLRVHSKFIISDYSSKKKIIKGISTLSAMFYFFHFLKKTSL